MRSNQTGGREQLKSTLWLLHWEGVICLWPEFDCPEVTLCGWQDIKIQLLLLQKKNLQLKSTKSTNRKTKPTQKLHRFSMSQSLQCCCGTKLKSLLSQNDIRGKTTQAEPQPCLHYWCHPSSPVIIVGCFRMGRWREQSLKKTFYI